MGAADLVFHLSLLGVLGLPARPGLQAGLDVILFVMAVMGGRVIPMFTNNGVPGANARRHATVEKLALGSTLVLLVADVLPVPAPTLALIALVCAVAHGARLALWDSLKTLGTPLVWILHAAYAWIVVHLALRAVAAMGWIAGAARHPRVDHRRDRRTHDRDDDPDRARPFRPSARGRRCGSRLLRAGLAGSGRAGAGAARGADRVPRERRRLGRALVGCVRAVLRPLLADPHRVRGSTASRADPSLAGGNAQRTRAGGYMSAACPTPRRKALR